MAMRKEEEADVMPSFAFGAGPDAGDVMAGAPSMFDLPTGAITIYSAGPRGPNVQWCPETGSVRVVPHGNWLTRLTPKTMDKGLSVREQTEEEDYRQQAQGISGGLPAAPRYTDTDLRALALEHAVATRTAEDKSSGTSVVDRADKFLKFLRGDT